MQAPPALFENLSEALVDICCIFLPFDCCAVITTDHKIIVVVYVVHITTAGLCADINPLIDHARLRFKVTPKRSLKYIIGIEIQQTLDVIELSQH